MPPRVLLPRQHPRSISVLYRPLSPQSSRQPAESNQSSRCRFRQKHINLRTASCRQAGCGRSAQIGRSWVVRHHLRHCSAFIPAPGRKEHGVLRLCQKAVGTAARSHCQPPTAHRSWQSGHSGQRRLVRSTAARRASFRQLLMCRNLCGSRCRAWQIPAHTAVRSQRLSSTGGRAMRSHNQKQLRSSSQHQCSICISRRRRRLACDRSRRRL